jgi:hypothetical protein
MHQVAVNLERRWNCLKVLYEWKLDEEQLVRYLLVEEAINGIHNCEHLGKLSEIIPIQNNFPLTKEVNHVIDVLPKKNMIDRMIKCNVALLFGFVCFPYTNYSGLRNAKLAKITKISVFLLKVFFFFFFFSIQSCNNLVL